MVKKSVNKSALVRDYMAKYPEKGPTAIAQQINEEKGVWTREKEEEMVSEEERGRVGMGVTSHPSHRSGSVGAGVGDRPVDPAFIFQEKEQTPIFP